MIIKQRDATERTVAALERRARIAGDEVLASGCRSAAARLRADPTSAEACDFVDHWFADAEDWAVIHDLRLRVDGHAIQINHVLIGDALDVVCLDTRWMRHGLELSAYGACRVHGDRGTRLVASPLDALARNVRKLDAELRHVGLPRTRLGLASRPALRGCVLVDPSFRSSAGAAGTRGAVAIHPRDALQTQFWKTGGRRLHTALDRLPAERLERLARALAERHRPSFSPRLLGDDITTVDGRTERLIAAG